jgi:hypothetical protein
MRSKDSAFKEDAGRMRASASRSPKRLPSGKTLVFPHFAATQGVAIRVFWDASGRQQAQGVFDQPAA